MRPESAADMAGSLSCWTRLLFEHEAAPVRAEQVAASSARTSCGWKPSSSRVADVKRKERKLPGAYRACVGRVYPESSRGLHEHAANKSLKLETFRPRPCSSLECVCLVPFVRADAPASELGRGEHSNVSPLGARWMKNRRGLRGRRYGTCAPVLPSHLQDLGIRFVTGGCRLDWRPLNWCSKMHFFRSYTYQIHLERDTGEQPRIQGIRWTPLQDSAAHLDYAQSMKEVSSKKIWRASRLLCTHLLSLSPSIIRDRKYHLRTYRQCCSGKELVDWLISASPAIQFRSQAVGIWQVLVDEGALIHVKQEINFQDKDYQFYRFMGVELPQNPVVSEKDFEEELQECLAFLALLGPDALLTMILRKAPSQRSEEELEVIFEELLHIKAVSHLSNSVKRELAAVLVFESHAKAGTVLFSQGDKGTSWYIIWKGSVNVVTHGKGLVTTLHEGDDFGQLALVNDAPRAATIILREDNCHFLRVDKQDFNRILRDVEANTVRLTEHARVVLVLERNQRGASANEQAASPVSNKYTVMSGTPEKILEHLLETMKLDSSVYDQTDTFFGDFLLTHSVYMPTSQLCQSLLHQYPLDFVVL
ncbi:hypothetical protein NDU88_000134 [Pleurodeles waltl]|uniref:Rap guanine nucleotide exchange factor 3 n=1 Tax=Pleurodeles waltl TaxID=8319 RepID=A0AAV7S8R9_PLEWA|nr:hypothetical protein NDU88_000134 [Pleurodeles waltl]